MHRDQCIESMITKNLAWPPKEINKAPITDLKAMEIRQRIQKSSRRNLVNYKNTQTTKENYENNAWTKLEVQSEI